VLLTVQLMYRLQQVGETATFKQDHYWAFTPNPNIIISGTNMGKANPIFSSTSSGRTENKTEYCRFFLVKKK
jgi:hypothetical protein